MIKKKLVYHLYIGEDFETNYAYTIHFKCLKHYINVFDSVNFVICIDNMLRESFLFKAYEWIHNLNFNGEITINVSENTVLREVKTFKEHVLDSNMCNEHVFFAHSKGISNLRDSTVNYDGIIIWIVLMYFYNLNFIDELNKKFIGDGVRPELFYGTLLTEYSRDNYPVLGHRSCCDYSGTFFWINGPRYHNAKLLGEFPDVVIGGRDFAEQYPGYFCDKKIHGQGLTSHNDISLNAEEFNLYCISNEDWYYITTILGDVDDFWSFYDLITK